MRRRSPWLAPLLLVACGAQPHAAPGEPAAAPSPVAPAPAATWRFHPRAPLGIRAVTALEGTGERIYAGRGGERWRVDVRTGRSEASPHPLADDLVAVAHDDVWTFVGASGRTWETDGPLGPALRAHAPPGRVVRLAARGAHLLAVDDRRALLRSDDGGRTWNEAVAPKRAWIDVAIDEAGRALALAAPEEIWTSTSPASAFARSEMPSFGARAVGRDAAGDLAVEGPFFSMVWRAGAFFARSSQPLADEAPVFAGAPAVEPSAAAIEEGRAALDDEGYAELARATAGAPWTLHAGRLDEPLGARPVAGTETCALVALAKRGATLEVACAVGAGTGARVHLLRSDDAGASFRDDGAGLVRAEGPLALALGEEGAALLAGACRPLRGKGCPDAFALARAAAEPTATWTPIDAPELRGRPLALAFDAAGRTAWLVAPRGDDGRTGVFRAQAGGAWTSLAVALEGTPSEVRLAPGEGASMTLLARGREGTRLVTLAEGGEPTRVAIGPAPDAEIGVSGARALAIAPGSAESWESRDGGSSWRPLAEPAPLRAKTGALAVRCAAAGCLVGTELTRLGWGERATATPALAPVLVEPVVAPKRPLVRASRVPLVCRLDAADWRPIAGLQRAPGAREADRGELAWSSVAFDPERASVDALHARGGARPAVARVPMLAPLRAGERAAWRVTAQVEGSAAMRVRLGDGAADPVSLRDVELAWDDRFAGRLVRTRLADAGAVPRGELRGGEGTRPAELRDAVLSITTGGLVVAPRARTLRGAPMFFVGERGRVERASWPEIPEADLRGRPLDLRADVARVEGRWIPFALTPGGDLFVRGRGDAGGWQLDAATLAAAEPEEARGSTWSFTYVARRPAIALLSADLASGSAAASLLVVRAEGEPLDAPVAAPTQLDLSDPPRPCTRADRRDTPRLVGPYLAGTRHPVLIDEPGGGRWHAMITAAAVLHGKPASACASAIEAVPLEEGPGAAGDRLLVPTADPEHAWAFRARGDGDVSWRAARCRFDEKAEVPPGFWAQDGTTRPGTP